MLVYSAFRIFEKYYSQTFLKQYKCKIIEEIMNKYIIKDLTGSIFVSGSA